MYMCTKLASLKALLEHSNYSARERVGVPFIKRGFPGGTCLFVVSEVGVGRESFRNGGFEN